MDEGRKVTLTVKSIDQREPWNRPGTTQHYYTVVTEDNPGEPTKFIGDQARDVKAPEIGKSYLGRQFGDKFYPAKVVNESPNSVTGNTNDVSDKPSGEYWDDKNAAIRAQWAINQSREYIQHMLGSEAKLTEILETAKLFYRMVDQVRGGSESPDPKVTTQS